MNADTGGAVKAGSAGANPSRSHRDRWIMAAYLAAARDGLINVKVLALSKESGLSRSSFYRNFGDLDELLAAVVFRWQAGELARLRRVASNFVNDARTDLMTLVDHYLSSGTSLVQACSLEQSLRFSIDSRNPLARSLAEVDRARMDQLTGRFSLELADPVVARQKATALYLVLCGAEQTVQAGTLTHREVADIRAAIVDQLTVFESATH